MKLLVITELCIYSNLFSRKPSQVALVVKNLPPNAGDTKDRFDPWIGKIPWRRKWKPAPVFLPGESHGHRSQEGCSPYGHTESDTTEASQYAWELEVRTQTRLLGKQNSTHYISYNVSTL